MTNIVPFDPVHYEVIAPQLEPERAHYTPSAGQGLREAGPAVTILNDAGAPIACAGLGLLGQGRAWAWAYVSPEARSRPFTLHRTLRRLLKLAVVKYELRRLETLTVSSFTTGAKWAESFGFRPSSSDVLQCPITQKEILHHVFEP